MSNTRFFLGSNTPVGYRHTAATLYDPADGWRVYLLKGGAGSGKSTLLRRIAAQDNDAELFLCSADPASLDGVRLSGRRVLVLDATAPHAVEPQYWGACERLVSLPADNERLYADRDRIRDLSDRCAALHVTARRQLAAAATAQTEWERVLRPLVDTAAIAAFAHRLAQTEWDVQPIDGKHERRFLTALTPDGIRPLFETAQALCPRLFVLVDEGGLASLLLSKLHREAEAAGMTALISPSVLFPDRIDQLLLPTIGTAFLTSNDQTVVDFPVYRRIHLSRFLSDGVLSEHRNRRHLWKRTVDECVNDAAIAAGEAKAVHDELETVTAAAADWRAVQRLGDDLLTDIFG